MKLNASIPLWLARMLEWLFRSSALSEVRREIEAHGEARVRAANQARLLLEVANRIAEPLESLPSGSRPAAVISVCREALAWALASELPDQRTTPQLKGLWENADRNRLRRVAGDEPTLVDVEQWLLVDSAKLLLDAGDGQAAAVRRFTAALIWELEGLTRREDRLRTQRRLRSLPLVAAALLVLFVFRNSMVGADLAEGKPLTTSSTYTCDKSQGCGKLLFHTQEEQDPWVLFDLGATRPLRRVEVTNRSDCCAERAVPLVVEVGVDRDHFSEVARRDTEFSDWTARFSAEARYVRLRVPRISTLHLEKVVIR